MADLALGDAITLSPKHFSGEVVFKLTTAQKKKIEKAMAAGRGCQLKLSAAQIKHMAQKGSGRFTDFLRSGVSAGVDLLKPMVKAGVAKGIDMGADIVAKKGSKFIKDKVGLGARPANKRPTGPARPFVPIVDQDGNGWLGKLARKAAHGGVDFIGDMMGVGAATGRPVAPNPNANPNEALRAAMFQKKVPVAAGSGLKW
jgi:hypothetical protein